MAANLPDGTEIKRVGEVATTRVIEFGDQHFAIRIRVETHGNTYKAHSVVPLSIDPKVTLFHEVASGSPANAIDQIVEYFYSAIPKKLMEMEEEAARAASGQDEKKQCKVRSLESDPGSPRVGDIWFNSTEKVLKCFLSGKVMEFSHPKALELTEDLRGDGAEGGDAAAAPEAPVAEQSEEEKPFNPYPPVSNDFYSSCHGIAKSEVHAIEFGVKIDVGEYSNLRRVALAHDLPMYEEVTKLTHCRGLGLCGTCEVLIGEGSHVNKPTIFEKLKGIKTPIGRRLGCQVQVQGPVNYRKPK